MGRVVAPPGMRDDPARIAERVGESLTRRARVTGELTTADSVHSVVKIVTYHMADAVGATIAAIALREGDQARVIGLRGLPASEAQQWELIPMTMATPVTDAIRTGRRLVLVGGAAIGRAYPDLGIDRDSGTSSHFSASRAGSPRRPTIRARSPSRRAIAAIVAPTASAMW